MLPFYLISRHNNLISNNEPLLVDYRDRFMKEGIMFGSGEILVILVVILILFGGKKLPEFAQSLGKGIREFKKACNGEEEILTSETMNEEVRPPILPHNSSQDHP
jgi:sec-independent protein translocase protein TatA